MTGHVHYSHFFAVWEGHPTEAKLDGHLACLFLLETIRVSARERGDEGRLTVVYMTCCSDNTHECFISSSSLPLSHDPLYVHMQRAIRERHSSIPEVVFRWCLLFVAVGLEG